MNSREMLALAINKVMLLSSDTSTAVVTAVDLANYFPVNKREVKVVASVITSSTSLGNAATIILEESDSTTTTTFTSVLDKDGSTVSWSLAANAVSFTTESHGIITKRYIRTRYVGSTATGGLIAISVTAFPLVRAA